MSNKLCVNVKKLFYGQWNYWIWWSELLLLIILSELIVKCVIGFDKFVRILEDGNGKSVPLFAKFSQYKALCKSEDLILKPMTLLDLTV